MGLAFIPLYIKYLGIEAYGVIGLFAVLQTSLALLDMGMAPTLGREMARFTGGSQSNEGLRDLLRSIEIIGMGVAILIATLVVTGSHWIAKSWLDAETMPDGEIAQALAIMGMVIALRFIESLYRSAILGLQRQVLLNVVTSIMSTLRWGGAACVIIWYSPSILAFVIWQGLVSGVMVVMLALATYASIPAGKRSGRFSLDALRQNWRFACGMVGITVLTVLLTQVDKILLSRLLPLADYGHYSLAVVVAGSVYMFINPITQAFYPRICSLHARQDNAALTATYHSGAQLVSVLSGSMAIVLILFPYPLLTLWTQDPVLAAKAAPLLSLLMLGNFMNGLMYIPHHTQLAFGWTRLALWSNLIAVTIILPSILWVVPRHGAEGAAWAWVGLNAGYVLISIHFMHRKILKDEKCRWYREDVILPLGSAAAIVLPLKWVMPEPQTALGQAGLLLLASALVLLAAVLAAGRTRRQILVNLKPRRRDLALPPQ